MKISAFEKYPAVYDLWFEKNRYVFLSELKAVEHFYKQSDYNLEIGVGTGRFALPLNIKYGIEPSSAMIKILKGKSQVSLVKGASEYIPFKNDSFDNILMITTICFVDNAELSINETYRLLKPGGQIIIGFVDSESRLGMFYQKNKKQSKFYNEATFYSTAEVADLLVKQRFNGISIIQTVFGNSIDLDSIQEFKSGSGEGSFIVIKAEK